MMRISTVASFGCGRTSHHRYVEPGNAPQSSSRSIARTYSP
ncbi:MAG TPA: hypothetical protein VGV90_18185 [Solirubrobacteraceae bacterium]|nr:hypothetical protein [Solirubrobacteraceae bacterium]